MHNVILRTITVTNAWQPLSATPLVGSVTISTPPTNAATVLFRSATEPEHEAFFINGEWHDFKRIDLSTIQVKGTPGDKVRGTRPSPANCGSTSATCSSTPMTTPTMPFTWTQAAVPSGSTPWGIRTS